MLTIYPACFYKEKEGYSVIFPDLNWLSTCGDTLEQAMEKAVECLAAYVYTAIKCNEPLPVPSKPSDIDPHTIATELDPEDSAEDSFVNMVSVDVDSYAKMYFEKPVKKTLSIPTWLNNAAIEQNINFSQVLQEALLVKLNLR